MGGEKFLVKNILFKFATAESKHELFDSTEVAAKVAGHDLKGLIQYFNLGVDLLHFPLMVLVDYLGFRYKITPTFLTSKGCKRYLGFLLTKIQSCMVSFFCVKS
jgi:hypothetical protein